MNPSTSQSAVRVTLFTGAFVAFLGCTSGESTGGAGGASSSATTATTTSTTATTTTTTAASTTGTASSSSTGTGGAASNPTVTKIGTPLWEPVDFHIASVDIGANFENFHSITAGVLPPPNHADHMQLGVGPGAAHAGPYTNEIGAGFLAKGYVDKDTFTKAESWSPMAILHAYMVVPSAGAPTGASPDGPNTPIIPNTIFPIKVSVAAFQDNVMLQDFDYSFNVPPLDSNLNPPFNNIDGHSHFPLFDGTFMDGVTTYPGTIENRVHLEDTNGNGYDLVFTYVGVN